MKPTKFNTDYRLWPLPKTKYSFYQEWKKVVFLHYKVKRKALERFVPKSLKLDSINGDYWVSIVAFDMKNIRPRLFPAFPLISDFQEVNLRTYVQCNGKSGVYFLSIKANKAISSLIARKISGLPYHFAEMKRTNHSFLLKDNKNKASIQYKIKEPIEKGSKLDRWLVERYALFMKKNNKIYRFDIHHSTWEIKNLELTKIEMDQPEFCSILSHPPEMAHYAEGTEVIAWNKVLEIVN